MNCLFIFFSFSLFFRLSSGFESQFKDTFFTIGVQGMRMEDKDKVEKVIADTFKETVKAGFDRKRIDAILHRTELALKVRNKKGFFGKTLFPRTCRALYFLSENNKGLWCL